MIAYNKTLLENTFLVQEAIDLKKSGFLDDSKLNNIKQQLATLKTNRNILVRIGFFLLGCLLFSSIIGFFTLITIDNLDNYHYAGFIYFFIGVIILEVLCKQNYFRHGLDDAFLIGSQMAFLFSIDVLAKTEIPLFISMIILGIIFCIRYVSTLSFLMTLTGIVALVAELFYPTTPYTLPSLFLLIAVGFYFLYEKIKNLSQLYFYQNVLEWFFIFTLLLGYASINYFIVLACVDLFIDDYSESKVPFGWIFNVLMFIIPALYVVYALKTKNRTMLYIGVLTFTLSIATYKYFHSVMPAEWALIIAGFLMFVAVYFVIQKIKTKPTGITFLPVPTTNSAVLSTVEALIINSQDMNHIETSEQPNMPFGGGGFSGGGAGGGY